MNKKGSQTQHRPSREENKKNEQLQELKAVCKKLAREKAQLEKELNRALQVKGQFTSEPEPRPEPKPQKGPKCPNCGTSYKILDLAGKDYAVCPECKWRKRL